MDDNGRVPSISPASENNSSEHSLGSFITLPSSSSISEGESKGGGGFMMNGLSKHITTNEKLIPAPPFQPPPPTSGHITFRSNEVNTPPLKRPRGRPVGSKNKLIPPSIISDNLLERVVIEIPPGNDVIALLIKYARHNQVNLTVLSAYGTVSNISIRQTRTCNGPALSFRGVYQMISLSGTFLNSHLPRSSSSTTTTTNDVPQCWHNNFVVHFSVGTEGAIYGGFIAGKLMAASLVVVTASVFKNFEYHKVPYIDGNMQAAEGGDHVSAPIGDHSGDLISVVAGNNSALVTSTMSDCAVVDGGNSDSPSTSYQW